MSDPRQLALSIAANSNCEKRKVGAVITNADGAVLAAGCNHNPDGGCCEDAAGATRSEVVHAEVAAINQMMIRKATGMSTIGPLTIYTTHAPCADCLAAIKEAAINNIVVVETFMKFDTDKLRFDLVLAEWQKGDAEILTHGAIKYKPNNWKEVDDLGRYIGALERHLNEFKLAYENKDYAKMLDADTGLHHMKHLRTNAGFLLTLTEELINNVDKS